jgi:hypothetical protein
VHEVALENANALAFQFAHQLAHEFAHEFAFEDDEDANVIAHTVQLAIAHVIAFDDDQIGNSFAFKDHPIAHALAHRFARGESVSTSSPSPVPQLKIMK